MRRKNILLFLFSVGMLLCSLSACSAQTDTNQATDEASPDGDGQTTRTHADLEQGVTLRDVANQLADEGITSFTARIAYTEHETYLQVDEALGGIEQALAAERARLVFLRDQFSESDSLEAPVKERFSLDIEAIDATVDLSVLWVEYAGEQVDLGELAVQQTAVETPDLEAATPNPDGIGTVKQAVVTDYGGDAWWIPAGGTSTIYTTGTLQKFWLDASALSLVDDSDSGLEIDTVIWGASNATCSTSGVSSNMPGYYADTEALDEGNRNCSVGTVASNQLQTWTLYWTWHPFGSFNAGANPFIAIMYQAKDWCPWVTNHAACYANRPWCMCAIDYPNQNPYPTEWLISYNYYDRPGQETSWTKN